MPRPKPQSAAKSKIRKPARKRPEKLRKAGLRPVQIWVPDKARPGFADECGRQSKMLASDPHEQELLDWLEKTAEDIEDWG